jgi:hypothetical protein
VGAPSTTPLTPLVTAPCTKAVVAIEVSLSPGLGVGAVGFPVKAGDANGALPASVRVMLATCPLSEATAEVSALMSLL